MRVYLFLSLCQFIGAFQNDIDNDYIEVPQNLQDSTRKHIIQYVNAMKYRSVKNVPTERKTDKTTIAPVNRYTFFPPVAHVAKKVNVPDSPYFPLDKNVEIKLRSKKLSSDRRRVKRSVVDRYVNAPQKTNAQKKKEEAPVELTRRLIAAKDAMIESYPYTISIQKDRQHWCGGALLNQRLIVSTANCFWKSDSISRMRIRAGSRFATSGGQTANIQEVMKHPTWSIRSNPDNDVALALLDRQIRFSHSVHSVDLPNHAMQPPFQDVWVTGWGAQRRDGMFDTRNGASLQVFHNYVLSRDRCNNVTRRFGVHITENFLCLTQRGKRAPCTRDTGSPAVSDGVIWGVASWGVRRKCGTERYPAVFSFLGSASNLWFITNATHYLQSDQRIYPYAGVYKKSQFDVNQ